MICKAQRDLARENRPTSLSRIRAAALARKMKTGVLQRRLRSCTRVVIVVCVIGV